MKRVDALRELSVDHHHGLVLARRAVRAGRGGDATEVDAAWREVRARFASELAPHFEAEERALLPALRAHGEEELAAGVERDHAALRRLVADAGEHDAQALGEFGRRLERHVRYEERVVFERAQEVLAAADLRAVERARASTGPRRDAGRSGADEPAGGGRGADAARAEGRDASDDPGPGGTP